jgi:hypothetical protein
MPRASDCRFGLRGGTTEEPAAVLDTSWRWVVPSFLWMTSSEHLPVLTSRPHDSASLLRSKCREARTAPPLLTLQPPLGSGTTWWEFLVMTKFYHHVVPDRRPHAESPPPKMTNL